MGDKIFDYIIYTVAILDLLVVVGGILSVILN